MAKNAIWYVATLFLSLVSIEITAQTTVKGQVADANTNEPLIGVTINVAGDIQGTITDVNGYFTLNVPGGATLSIKYLGYKEVTRRIPQQQQVDLGVILLEGESYMLDDVIITSSIAVSRKTPTAMTNLEPAFIEERIGMQDFPELLKSTPSIYVSKGGGGFGDTEISLRGFRTENIAVMVNGVPMNDMEWGGVYWSNWTSFADVTRSKQIQRGLGAAKVAAPTIGGSINIITNSIDAKKGGSVSYGVGQDGFNKLTFSVSTGLSKSGWAMSVMGGKEWGDGYIQGTEYESYTYFMNISKRINDSHQISLTAFGSPQWHNQRSQYDGLTIKGWQEVKKYMSEGEEYRYNPTYGFDKNGVRKMANKNKYHKPQISLNHMWQIDASSSLCTAFYVSLGDGWGHSGQGTSDYTTGWYGSINGVLNTRFRNADGTFAYNKIQEMNEASDNGSQMVMSVSKNNHRWYGLLSTYTKELNENLNFHVGIDARYYKGIHTNEIIDLYNGKYYIDRFRANVLPVNNAAAADPGFANRKLTVGDVVFRDYDGYIVQGGGFAQAEYTKDKLNVFVSGSINNNTQWRYDRFYYDKAHARSEKVDKIGYTIKGGVNYNITNNHNVFANIGYISHVPYLSKGIFFNSDNSNLVNPNSKNENSFGIELGYGFQSRFFAANVNAYHTEWQNKTMTAITDEMDINGIKDRATISIEGVDAIHEGVELEFTARPYQWVNVRGMFSLGNWRWIDDASGYWYNSAGQPLTADKGIASGIAATDHAQSVIDLDGVKVGGAAQTSAAMGLDFKPSKDIRLSLDWNFFGRNYANWSFTDPTLGSTQDYDTPWRIPSANTFDLSASYSFEIAGLRTMLSGNITNLFDQEYVQSAMNGLDNDWKTAYRVYYGFGRRMSVKLRINF